MTRDQSTKQRTDRHRGLRAAAACAGVAIAFATLTAVSPAVSPSEAVTAPA
jgi:hypothetical protein